MKINVWHSIEQRTSDLSIDQWHSRFKIWHFLPKSDILNTKHKLILVVRHTPVTSGRGPSAPNFRNPYLRKNGLTYKFAG